MGRKKIQIKAITDEKNRLVTFAKRKNGLFKKAYELSILCGCEIALIVFTRSDRLHQYASTTMEHALKRRDSHPKAHEFYSNADMCKILQVRSGLRRQPESSELSEENDNSRETSDVLVIDISDASDTDGPNPPKRRQCLPVDSVDQLTSVIKMDKSSSPVDFASKSCIKHQELDLPSHDPGYQPNSIYATLSKNNPSSLHHSPDSTVFVSDTHPILTSGIQCIPKDEERAKSPECAYSACDDKTSKDSSHEIHQSTIDAYDVAPAESPATEASDSTSSQRLSDSTVNQSSIPLSKSRHFRPKCHPPLSRLVMPRVGSLHYSTATPSSVSPGTFLPTPEVETELKKLELQHGLSNGLDPQTLVASPLSLPVPPMGLLSSITLSPPVQLGFISPFDPISPSPTAQPSLHDHMFTAFHPIRSAVSSSECLLPERLSNGSDDIANRSLNSHADRSDPKGLTGCNPSSASKTAIKPHKRIVF